MGTKARPRSLPLGLLSLFTRSTFVCYDPKRRVEVIPGREIFIYEKSHSSKYR
jgi:hypothetical protein